MNNVLKGGLLLFCFAICASLVSAQEWVEIEYKFPTNDEVSTIRVQEWKDYYVYQGDIILEKTPHRGVLGGNVNLWPCGKVPYVLSDQLNSNQRRFSEEAIVQVNNSTALEWIPRTDEENYVEFVDCPDCTAGGFCSSPLGMRGGRQTLNLAASGCGSWPVVAHEMLHAAGFLHEQSRRDRDNYVIINYENIRPSSRFNFDIDNSSTAYGPYDFESVMHYGRFAFSMNGEPTIETVNGESIGQRERLSVGDVQAVADVYPCGVSETDNDECINAKVLTGCFTSIDNNFNTSESQEVPVFTCATGGIKDVWFKLFPQFTSLTIETVPVDDGLNDLVMQVFSGTCENLVELGCNDNGGVGLHARLSLSNLTLFEPLYIRITEKRGDDYGDFGIYYSINNSTGNEIYKTTNVVEGEGRNIHIRPTVNGDINGDNKADIMFLGSGWDGPGLNIATKISNGDGTYIDKSVVEGDGNEIFSYPPIVGDVDDNDFDDIIFIGQDWQGGGLNIRTKFSNGDGTYTTFNEVEGDPADIHAYPALTGDVNGDGKLDLMFVGQNWSGGQGLNIVTKISNGDGSFSSVTDLQGDGAEIHENKTLTGDVNGDGMTDLIFVGRDWDGFGLNIVTKMSNGDGTYTDMRQVVGDGANIYVYPPIAGDFDGDGTTDVVFIGQNWTGFGLNIRTKFSNGDGTFESRNDVEGDGDFIHNYPVMVGDMNGNGRTDLMFVGQNWRGCGMNLIVKLSAGDGSYINDWQVTGEDISIHNYPTLVGDVNGDNRVDLVFVGQNWEGNGLNINTKLSEGPTATEEDPELEVFQNNLKVFPNPTKGLVTVDSKLGSDLTLNVFDIGGNSVFASRGISGPTEVNISHLPHGLYLFEISDPIAGHKAIRKVTLVK